ncbi:hypothetical protein ACHAPK_000313 [Fusarium culmorum]
MLSAVRTARLRSLIKHSRTIHSSSKHLSSTEAAPAARPAHYDTSQKLSAIDAVKERRLKAGKLVAGVAAASDSDMFKGPTTGLPKSKRWDSMLCPKIGK